MNNLVVIFLAKLSGFIVLLFVCFFMALFNVFIVDNNLLYMKNKKLRTFFIKMKKIMWSGMIIFMLVKGSYYLWFK